MMKSILPLVLLAAPPARAASAASVSTGAVTLGTVLETVERENPEVAALRAAWDAARERGAQDATPSQPRLGLERMFSPVGRSLLSGAREKNVTVTQEFPFPTTLYLRGRRASRDAGIAEQAYRAKVQEVRARAARTYAALYLARRAGDIFRENTEIMRRFSKVAESRYAAGRAGQLDALKAQAELTRMLNMTAAAERDETTESAALAALMGREAGEPMPPLADPDPGRLDLREDALQTQALEGRPELVGAGLAERRAGTDLALARSEFLPDLMLEFRYRRDAAMGDSRDAMLGLSVPLWFWRPAARVAEAKAAKAGAEADLRVMRLRTSADVSEARAQAETAMRLAQVYRTTLIPQAETALRVAESGYQSGASSFLDMLDAQRSLLSYRLEYYQELADFERGLADLERIVGRELRKP